MSVHKKALIVFFLSILIGLSILFLFNSSRVSSLKIKDVKAEYEKLAAENRQCREKSAKAENEFKALEADRNNALIQVKKLLSYRERGEKLESDIENAKTAISAVEKEKLDIIQQNLSSQEEIKKLEGIQGKINNEKKQLENMLAKERDKSVVKKMESAKLNLEKDKTELTSRLKVFEAAKAKLKDDVLRLEKELVSLKKIEQEKINLEKLNSELAGGLKQARFDVNRLSGEIIKSRQEQVKAREEAEVSREKLGSLNQKYSEAISKNRTLEEKVVHAPKKFAEIARQNKALIKQASNMHYNLGVFYTKNKEYSRAVAEFEEAVRLRPDDAYSHFNLGYIYAEYLVNRPKAIEHFRHYLRVARKEDKDMDWVKKYIITWQAWGGKEPME